MCSNVRLGGGLTPRNSSFRRPKCAKSLTSSESSQQVLSGATVFKFQSLSELGQLFGSVLGNNRFKSKDRILLLKSQLNHVLERLLKGLTQKQIITRTTDTVASVSQVLKLFDSELTVR